MTNIIDAFRQLRSDRSGNIAIITALGALPMLGMFGLCIDYGIATMAKSKLDAAADAAAIAAASATQAAAVAKSSDPSAEGKARGLSVFKANAGSVSFLGSGSPPVPTIDVTASPDGSTVQANVTYTTTTINQFGGLFGVKKTNLNGAAKSSLAPKNINIYLVVDISQSMGIAATADGMDKLYSRTSCVFGCHVLDNDQYITNEQVAKDNNIKLRIGVVKDAVTNMITQLQSSSGSATTKLGIYTLEFDLKTLAPIQANTASLLAKAASIDLGDNIPPGGGQSRADSFAQRSLETLTSTVGKSGDGSVDNPQKFVFILTDGTADQLNSTKIIPYKAEWVQSLKKNEVTVGVLYTTYLPIYAYNNPNAGLDDSYAIGVAPINRSNDSDIRKGLQQCVSAPNWFIEATDSSLIQSALNQLVSRAQLSNRLTN